MGVWKRIAPLCSVATQLKILMPVGTPIKTVVNDMNTRSQCGMPEVNMWCAQIKKPRMAIAHSARTMDFWPKIGLRDMVESTSENTPKPGRIMTYTAGCE